VETNSHRIRPGLEQAILAPARNEAYQYRPRKGVWLGLVVLLLLAAGSTGALGFGMFDSERSSLKRGAGRLADCLIKADCESLVELFPESDEGLTLLAAANQKAFGVDVASGQNQKSSQERLAELQLKRAELERLGLDWKNAKAVAIGGIRARVSDEQLMKGDISVFAGFLYIENGESLHALELTARLCEGKWIFLDTLKCKKVAKSAGGAKQDTKETYNAFANETDRIPGAQLAGARMVYIPLN
jgi:hypothetical protein